MRMIKVTQGRELAVDGSDKDDKGRATIVRFLDEFEWTRRASVERLFWPTSNPLFQGVGLL